MQNNICTVVSLRIINQLSTLMRDMAVKYNEIAGIWIAPDKAGLGKDPGASREAVEATDVFKAFRRQVEKLSGGAKLSARFETAGS